MSLGTDDWKEVAAFMGGLCLMAALICGAVSATAYFTAEKMKACAQMCGGGTGEYRHDECTCRGKP